MPHAHGSVPEVPRTHVPYTGKPSRSYLVFTFAFVALVALLLVTGQFFALAVLLVLCLVYAPQITQWVVKNDQSRSSARRG